MRQALFASDAPNEYQAWAAHDARANGGYRMILLAPRRITIMRWIARYVPKFEKRWNRFACRVGTSWGSGANFGKGTYCS